MVLVTQEFWLSVLACCQQLADVVHALHGCLLVLYISDKCCQTSCRRAVNTLASRRHRLRSKHGRRKHMLHVPETLIYAL